MAKRRFTSAIAVLAVVTVLSAACGSSDPDPDPVAEGLPINPDSGDDEPGTASACLAGEPDCDDDPALPDDGQDLPPLDEEPESAPVSSDGEVSTGMPVDGGLTVGEALATDVTGILAVSGYGFDEGNGVRLCERLDPGGERYECGGVSVVVENLDLTEMGADIVIHDGLTYTQDEIVLFGEMADGVLVLRETVTG
jgi:hypothetical protein